MDIDIDNFIKDQKSKIAQERKYLSHQNYLQSQFNSVYSVGDNLKNYNSSFMNLKEKENRNQENGRDLKIDIVNSAKTSSRKENRSFDDKTDQGGSLPGLSYSNSASKRKEIIRNHEYNEFKKLDEENFKNRFANKKNTSLNQEFRSETNLFMNKNLLTTQPNVRNNSDLSSLVKSKSSILNRDNVTTSSINNVNNSAISNSTSSLDLLERKVEDLRRFKLEPGPQHRAVPDDDRYRLPAYVSPLRDTENRLLEIERQYDESKNRLIQYQKTTEMGRTSRHNDENLSSVSNDRKSILPTARDDEESIRRRKQEKYRRDLEDQMKERSRKPRSAEISTTNDGVGQVSFFDRFGAGSGSGTAGGSRFRKSDSLPNHDVDRTDQGDYFHYYASRSPLDEFPATLSEINNNQDRIDDFLIGNQSSVTTTTAAKKEKYGLELKRQIEERKIRRQIDKKQLDDYERRKNEEILNYDPFGRGGGGAPLKDFQGDTIANLKLYSNMTMPPVARPLSPTYRSQIASIDHGIGGGTASRNDSKWADFSDSESSARKKTFARGGHGIFGQALTEEDKMKAERYKEELTAQIESNRRKREIDRENERIREEKEREKFDKEQKQIQLELEKERRIQHQKELERLQRLEESKIAAAAASASSSSTTKKQRHVSDRLEPPVSSSREPRRDSPSTIRPIVDWDSQIESRQNQEGFQRSSSPVFRSHHQKADNNQSKSPLIIRESIPLDLKPDQGDITRKLQQLKSQIMNESAKLEKELAGQDNDEQHREKDNVRRVSNQNQSNHSADIFQSVLDHRGPLSVRRGFGKMKTTDQNSLYPVDRSNQPSVHHVPVSPPPPMSVDGDDFPSLSGRSRRKRSEFPHTSLVRSQSEMSNQLEADTDFIAFSQSRDFSLKNSFNDSEFRSVAPLYAKPNEFGSDTSLNIDELTRKNHERLRKLKQTKYENGIYQTPEDVLDKISRLQDHHQLNLFTDQL